MCGVWCLIVYVFYLMSMGVLSPTCDESDIKPCSWNDSNVKYTIYTIYNVGQANIDTV